LIGRQTVSLRQSAGSKAGRAGLALGVVDDLARWHRQLGVIVDAVADANRVLGIARASAPLSDAVLDAAESRADRLLERIVELVQQANDLAGRLHAADRSLADVVHPLLGVPGERPEVDLRPWWSRLLQKVSSTANRIAWAESLETLRLEADAALLRATGRLARAGARAD
jgi:hypothetical protein